MLDTCVLFYDCFTLMTMTNSNGFIFITGMSEMVVVDFTSGSALKFELRYLSNAVLKQ